MRCARCRDHPPLFLEIRGRAPRYKYTDYRNLTVLAIMPRYYRYSSVTPTGRLLHRVGALLNRLRRGGSSLFLGMPQFSSSRDIYTFHARGNHSLTLITVIANERKSNYYTRVRMPIIRASSLPCHPVFIFALFIYGAKYVFRNTWHYTRND